MWRFVRLGVLLLLRVSGLLIDLIRFVRCGNVELDFGLRSIRFMLVNLLIFLVVSAILNFLFRCGCAQLGVFPRATW